MAACRSEPAVSLAFINHYSFQRAGVALFEISPSAFKLKDPRNARAMNRPRNCLVDKRGGSDCAWVVLLN